MRLIFTLFFGVPVSPDLANPAIPSLRQKHSNTLYSNQAHFSHPNSEDMSDNRFFSVEKSSAKRKKVSSDDNVSSDDSCTVSCKKHNNQSYRGNYVSLIVVIFSK
jgi:hypothetical protein